MYPVREFSVSFNIQCALDILARATHERENTMTVQMHMNNNIIIVICYYDAQCACALTSHQIE